MKYLLTILLIFLSITSQAQSFSIGSTSITFTDASRSNRQIATDIYYPAATNGSNVPLAGTDRFPVVVFGHGFSMTVDAYQNIWSSLVPQGYIVALPKTEGGLFPNHANFGRDLAYVVTALQNRGNTSGNIFTNRIASTSCVMGHSMGGGCSFLAMSFNPNISIVSALAPAETSTSAIGSASTITRPALLFTGGNDCVTPTANNGGAIYNALASGCKTMINVIGGSHCQFANSNFNCSFGESTCSPGPTINRTTQHALVNKYLVPWLNFRLKNVCSQWTSLQAVLTTDAAVSYQQSCPSPFSCTLPLNTSTTGITAASARANWTTATCTYGYQVRFRKSNTTSWTSSATINALQFTINGLQSSTNYEWQVRTVCDSTSTSLSAWTTSKKFKTTASRISGGNSENGESTTTNALHASIHPNPNNGVFKLELDRNHEAPVKVVIYNTIGKLIETQSIQSNNGFDFSIDLSNQPAGIYIVQYSDGKQISTKRVIVQ